MEQGYDAAALMVSHTWNQKLDAHGHVHAVVPGGGPALDGSDFLDIVTRPFLMMTILEGRNGTAMQAWNEHEEQPVGLEEARALTDYVVSLGGRRQPESTDVETGGVGR